MTDTLIDAGPLIALLSRSDSYHASCVPLFRELNCPFVTTLPVITEAMYFLATYGGSAGREALWRMIHRGDLLLEHPGPQELKRMDELMQKYGDLPMDFADASLVAVAERLSLDRVFTLDRGDFSVYRLNGKQPFTIIGPKG
jgi:uncharacterized protein